MKKGFFSKLIIAGVIIANVIFTVTVLYIFLQTASEPMTLIGAWFGFTTVELWNLASIKKKKIDMFSEEEECCNDGCDI